jgi:subfamily B ATP-binding cassette protein MsbA
MAGMIDPARKLSSTYAKLKRATAAADRVFELLDRKPLVIQTAQPKRMPRHSRSIEFRKITFSYASSGEELQVRPPVLNDVSLKVRHGEVIVVVGENGSGKSTLVNLLPRYFDPGVGSVLIDGVETRDVRLRDLREQIGVVTQETLLFDESIYDNILYGKPSATREEVEEAARRAHVTAFVEGLPDGFGTRVGERGGRLSGGQRQRIALARAILRDPTILILDEATSAIDSTSELLIHETLREFSRGRTVFIITHTVSQSILDFVTRIVVMDQGRLIAAGPHEMLLQTCPVYEKLYRSRVQQSAGIEEAEEGEPEAARHERPASAGDQGTPHILRLPAHRAAGGRGTAGDGSQASGDAAGY